MDTTSISTAARALAAEAMLIARLADGDERVALLAIARALRSPDRVARLLVESEEDQQHAHNIPA